MYRDRETQTVPLFTITGREIRALMTIKVETMATSAADLEQAASRAVPGSPLASRYLDLVQGLRRHGRGLAFARDHVDVDAVFKMTGEQLGCIQDDLDVSPLDIEEIRRLFEREQEYSQRAQNALGPMDECVPLLQKAGVQSGAVHWRRW